MASHILDANEIAGICLMLVGLLLLTPILCFSLYQFYSINAISTDLLNYRNTTLVYAMNVLAILSFCTERIFVILSEILHEIHVPKWLPFIAEYSFILGFYTLFLIKTWLSFYSREYHRKLAQLTWYQELNANTHKKDHWIIKYKNKIGNPHYLMKVGFVLFLFQIFIEIILDITIGNAVLIDHIITLIYTLFVFIISFVLYFKTRDFNDIYHIKKEIQYQTYILSFILFTEFATVTYEMIHEYNAVHSGNYIPNTLHPVEWITMLVLEDILWFSIALISTAYPVYLYKQSIIKSPMKRMHMDSDAKHYLYLMLQIMSSKDGFKSFMLHLVKEYSTENLLFILELVQIKSEFQINHNNVLNLPKRIDLKSLSSGKEPDNAKIACADTVTVDFNDDEDNNDTTKTINTYLTFHNGSIYSKIRLPSKLQKSAVLEQSRNDLCKQMMYLYNKYVKVESEYEINISYETRNDLKCLFESNVNDHIKSECDIFNAMDESAIEVVRLLYGSFHRFQDTAVYMELSESIININLNKH